MKLDNPHLRELAIDQFHHLGFSSDSVGLLKFYQDVKFVCLSGSTNRVKTFALFLNKELNFHKDEDEVLTNLCLTDRYVMHKVGPVLIANHGMGVPSLRIILNELFKLLHYAEAKDVTFFRIGTSGGIGLNPGSVVLTKRAVNGLFETKMSEIILGEMKEMSTELQYSNFEKLLKVAEGVHETKSFEFVFGDTMCCDDFYEGQGRLDGAFCTYSNEDRLNYLKKAYEHGVRNIEMESSLFTALCNKAQVNAFVVCVTLLDRLLGDQIVVSKEVLHEYEMRPFWLVLAYIRLCRSETM